MAIEDMYGDLASEFETHEISPVDPDDSDVVEEGRVFIGSAANFADPAFLANESDEPQYRITYEVTHPGGNHYRVLVVKHVFDEDGRESPRSSRTFHDSMNQQSMAPPEGTR